MGKIIVGNKYDRLLVTAKLVGDRFDCLCDCGKEVSRSRWTLQSNQKKSCGCWRIEMIVERCTTHGKSHTLTHRSWGYMRSRCLDPNSSSYSYYGGRGVTICKQWDSFEQFLKDLGPRPKGKTLDRIDPNGNYEPSNCRWATRREQCWNKRNSRIVTAFGESKILEEWARDPRAVVGSKCIGNRIARGFTPEQSITTPGQLIKNKK